MVLLCRPAAIDRNGSAVDLRCRIACEESGNGANLCGSDKFLRWLFVQHHFADHAFAVHVIGLHLVRYLRLDKRGQDIAGADGIGGDLCGCKFQRQRFGEADNAVLGGHICRLERRCHEAMR